MALRPLEQAIVYTLAYTLQFQYPLTPAELSDRLLFRLDDEVLLTKATRSEIALCVSGLLKRGVLIKKGEYLTLPGFEKAIATRELRQTYSAARRPELSDFVALSQACPWVEAIFITGSLAMNNGERDADIDFLVVTQPGRLWLTRLWLLLVAMSRGKRRSFQGEEKNSWCFNLWVESDQLAVFGEQPSVYTAYELLQAQPLWDRHQWVAPALIEENYWAKAYVSRSAKWTAARKLLAKSKDGIRPGQGWLTTLNTLAFKLQYWYMKSHMTREKVSLQYAFFHPRDTQSWIYAGWVFILRQSAL